MTYEEPYRDRYKKIRTGWWLGLSAVWLAFWYWQLSSKPKVARDCEGTINSFGCGLGDDLSTASVFLSMMVALIATPIMLIPARAIARHFIDQEIAVDTKKAKEDNERAVAALSLSQRTRHAEAERQVQANRSSIHRSEFLQKLGAVSDLLRLLADEDDKGEIRQLKLGVAQSLRDLTAKHTLDELASFIRGDGAIGLAVPPVLDALEDAGLDTSPEARILDEAMSRAIARA